MKKLYTFVICLTAIVLWSDTTSAQINLYRKYKHKRHKNIYLQDNSSQSESSISAALYATAIQFNSGSGIPFMYGGTAMGSYHPTEKTHFDVGFTYLAPASTNQNDGADASGLSTTVKNTFSAYEITFRGGWDFVGNINEDYSFGAVAGGTLMILGVASETTFSGGGIATQSQSSKDSYQQFFLNVGLTGGLKAGPGQIKADAIFAFPANQVNGQAVAVQLAAVYLKYNLGYVIPF